MAAYDDNHGYLLLTLPRCSRYGIEAKGGTVALVQVGRLAIVLAYGFVAIGCGHQHLDAEPDALTPDTSPDADARVDGSPDAAPDAPDFTCTVAGAPDLGFGTNGFVTPIFGFGGMAGAGAVAIDPTTSRILIAGSASHDGGSAFAVVRLLPDGSLDASFGTGGAVVIGIPRHDCFINDIVLQPDGKLVAVGGVNDDQRARLGMLRLNADGSPDVTFGAGGIVVTEPGVLSQGTGVDVDSSSRILVSVATWDGPNALDESRFTTLRFLSSGAPDLSFGSGGVAEPAFDNGQDVAYDVLVQADNRVLVAGAVASLDASVVPKFGVVRYLDDGVLDMSFGTGGLATMDVLDGAAAYGAVLDGANHPLLVGEAGPQMGAISRFTTLGAADTTFGQTGATTVPIPPGLQNAAVDGSGDILAVGSRGLVRFQLSGAVDPTFGTNGVVAPGSVHDLDADVAIQSDARIVVVGTRMSGTASAPKSDFFAARYCP